MEKQAPSLKPTASGNQQPADGFRLASAEEFSKAQAKTSTLHAGLFRRLAQ